MNISKYFLGDCPSLNQGIHSRKNKTINLRHVTIFQFQISNHVSHPKNVIYSNIIYSVCHPVKRLISRYYHALAIRPDTINDLGDFEHYQNKLKHFKKNATSEFQAVYDDENVDDKIQALTETYLERILLRC